MKILAVDDDPIILELLTAILESNRKYRVTCCESADAALAALSQGGQVYDCILLDIQMPVMDGIELLGVLRQRPDCRTMPILMITAMADKDYMTRAFEAGATDYITKPFDVMELTTRVGIAARLARSQKAAAAQMDVIMKLKQADPAPRLKLEDRFALTDIAGAIDFVSFENYLLRLPRGALIGSVLFATSIRDVVRLHRRASQYEFMGAVTDVAECISNVMKRNAFYFTYAGNGLFALMVEAARGFDAEAFRKAVHAEIGQLDPCFNDGTPMTLGLDLGPVRPLGLRSGRGAVDVLMAALANAELMALEDRDRRGADFVDNPGQRIAG
jgi:CheY-like chemotaxis protein